MKRAVFKNSLILGLFIIFCIVMIFKFYDYTKIEKEDLNYQEITFDYFQEGPNSKNKHRYIIFDTKGIGYGIGSIIDVDYDKIYSIEKNTKVEVYVIEANDKYYQWEIIELYVGNEAIITIDDYHEDYTNHMKLTIIVISIFLAVIISLMIFLPKIIDKISEKKLKKDIDYNSSYAIKKYDEFQKRIYYDQNKYVADFEECLDKPEDIYYLCKVMADNMLDGEIRLIYEKNSEEGIINFFYKYNNQVCFDFILEEEKGIIKIYEELLMWSYPKYKDLTKEEIEYLKQLIENCNKLNDIKLIFVPEKK